MKFEDVLAKVAELEKRLEIKETALNEALKEIENLKKINFSRCNSIKDMVEPKVYENLFNYGFDKKNRNIMFGRRKQAI